MHRVAITGLGLVTALGPDLPTSWNRLVAGENGIGRITYFDPAEYACQVAAEVRNLPDVPTGLSNIPADHCRRTVRLFLRSAREAYADAGLATAGLDAQRIGVAAGASVNYVNAAGASVNYVNMSLVRRYHRYVRPDAPVLDLQRFAREGQQPANSFHRRLGDLAAGVPAQVLDCRGPSFVVDTACAASAHAIGEGFRLIRRGTVDAMIAGGAAGLVSPVGILAFSTLGALSRNPDPDCASRPFDRRRDGFVMGEGGGAVVLENLQRARARGARVYAELAGFGTTTNAQTLTDPSADGVCEERAMSLALSDASLPLETIDYVAAHGTSTPKNDVVETRAIKRLFGDRARELLVSSNKGQLGHTIAAAGVCNLIAATKAIAHGCVPPTAHYEEPDPECDLDYVPNRPRPRAVRAALANAFAFGGQNAVLVVRRYEPNDPVVH